MKIVFQNVLWLVAFVAYQYFCMANDVNIGVVFSEENDQSELVLKSTLHKKNTVDHGASFNSSVKQISNIDYFEASMTLCNLLEDNEGVAAVIGMKSLTSSILEATCDQFEVPYIMTSWRPSTTKQTNTLLNFFPKADLFAQALADVVKSLEWNNFVILYETEEGLIRVQDILKLQGIDNKHTNILVKQLSSTDNDRSILKEIKKALETNIILDCETEHIIPILQQAKEQNLLNMQNSYFLTSLDAHTLDYTQLNTQANITTVRLFDFVTEDFNNTLERWNLPSGNEQIRLERHKIRTETVLFHDALLHLTDSINDLKHTQKDIAAVPINCFGETKSRNGYVLAAYMKERQPTLTLSGPLKFDDYGNRIDFNLHVVDVHKNEVIANWIASNASLIMRRNSSDTENAAVTNLQSTTVIVSSRTGDGYLMKKRPKEGEKLYGNDQYEGYSMDLIQEVANLIGFKFEFVLAEDGEYGKWDEKQRKWTGLIGDILYGVSNDVGNRKILYEKVISLLFHKAHLAICDLTITPDRREVVDFSAPFMDLGISILYKVEEEKDIDMFAFFYPFSMSVWIYSATLYLIISVVLLFISRMTPGDWENPHPCDEHPEELENIWDIKNCLWLTLGSIMTQGCDILPKGISSRMAVSMWWFFSLILANSYMANLTAFLTKGKMEGAIDSAEALAKQTKVKYGLMDGGSTMGFFKNSNDTTYHKMWTFMESSKPSVFEKSNENGVNRVQAAKGGYAFLMESTQIEYQIETKCDLKQVGDNLDSKSYGIAMPLNSGYRTAINKAILKLQESGKLKELKDRWWKKNRKEPSCESSESKESSDKMHMAHVIGMFFVLGIGIAMAVMFALFEFLWNVRSVSVEEHLTYLEALKIELKFACSVWIMKKRTKPVSSSSSSSSGCDRTNNIDRNDL